jgi:FMN phosphatase YigB (HAD superfamily)
MYRLALDMSHTQPEQTVYIDDQALFIETARCLGIQGVCHTSYPPDTGCTGATRLIITSTERTRYGGASCVVTLSETTLPGCSHKAMA